MDLLQLRYFIAVARTEHMTRAAEELGVAQPALSMMISRLEKDLGQSLFDRHGRNINLNQYGKILLKKAESSLLLLDDARREIADLSAMNQNSISLLVKSTSYYSELVGSFMSLYPDTTFRFEQTSNESRCIELLEKGEIDLCFATPPIYKPGIAGVEVYTEKVFLAIPASHRFADRENVPLVAVSNDRFISLKAGCSIRATLEVACKSSGFTPKIVCELDDSSAIGSLVQAGLGIALLSEAAKEQNPELKFLHIDSPACTCTLQLAWLEQRYLSEKVRKFRDYVVQWFEAESRNTKE